MDKLTELKRHNCVLEESSKMQQKTMELEYKMKMLTGYNRN